MLTIGRTHWVRRTLTIGIGLAALMVCWGQIKPVQPAAKPAEYIGEARCIE